MIVKIRGFTLFELMVTVAILAILTVLAIPVMTNLINSNKVKVASSDMTNFLQQARSDAIRTGTTTTICASSDGTSCVASNKTAWNVGVISKTTAITSTSTQVVNAKLSFNNQNVTITGPEKIDFNSIGATTNAYQITVSMTGQDTYSICVAVAGRAERVKGANCP